MTTLLPPTIITARTRETAQLEFENHVIARAARIIHHCIGYGWPRPTLNTPSNPRTNENPTSPSGTGFLLERWEYNVQGNPVIARFAFGEAAFSTRMAVAPEHHAVQILEFMLDDRLFMLDCMAALRWLIWPHVSVSKK